MIQRRVAAGRRQRCGRLARRGLWTSPVGGTAPDHHALAYSLGGDWRSWTGCTSHGDAHHIEDPRSGFNGHNPWLKIFTAGYVLVGIAILVEVARRLGGVHSARAKVEKSKAAAKMSGRCWRRIRERGLTARAAVAMRFRRLRRRASQPLACSSFRLIAALLGRGLAAPTGYRLGAGRAATEPVTARSRRRVTVIAKELLMGRQADEKLPETEACGVAPPSHDPSQRAHAGAVFSPNPR